MRARLSMVAFLLPSLALLAAAGQAQGTRTRQRLPVLQPAGGPGLRPWALAFGGTDFDAAAALAEAAGGDLFAAGHTRSSGAGGADAWVARLGPEGRVRWERAIGGTGEDLALSLAATPDGGCIVAGVTSSFGAGGEDGWILKLGASGAIEWQRTYGSAGQDAFAAIAASPRGYFVGGALEDAGLLHDAWILEIDSTGDVLWQESFGGGGDDRLRSLAATTGGVAFSADSNSALGGVEVPFFRPWLVRLDGDGAALWQRSYDFSGGDSWSQLVALEGGGFVATGEILATGFFRGDLWVVRLDDAGAIVWDARFGDHFGIPGYDAGLGVRPAPGGGFVVLGSTGTAGPTDLWLVGLDSRGELAWEQTFGGPGLDNGAALCVSSGGDCLLAGDSGSFGAGSADAFLLRVPPGGVATGCDLSRATAPAAWSSALAVAAPAVPPELTGVVPQASGARVTVLATRSVVCPD